QKKVGAEAGVVVRRGERLRIAPRGQACYIINVVIKAYVLTFGVDAEVRPDEVLVRRDGCGQLSFVALLIVALGVVDRRRGDGLPRGVVLRPAPGGEGPETIAHGAPAEPRRPHVIEIVL